MKFGLKQLVAAMLAGAISVSCVFAENLGLKKANIISTALEGVQESTPVDNSFIYDGKKDIQYCIACIYLLTVFGDLFWLQYLTNDSYPSADILSAKVFFVS